MALRAKVASTNNYGYLSKLFWYATPIRTTISVVYDWVFLSQYLNDYLALGKWMPNLYDFIRYKWLMVQCYGKESRHLIELLNRDEQSKVTVQERKFLHSYIKNRFQAYNEYVEEDELAHFRSAVAVDYTIKSHEKPLFPNITESYLDDTRLAYWNKKEMKTEYIPAESFGFTKLNTQRKITKKWKKREKVTYAYMRAMFNSDTIKIHDLEFILHCLDKHQGRPKDSTEKMIYDQLFPAYSIELTHLAQMMNIPELRNLALANPKKRLIHLYIAYKQRWLGVNKVKDFEKVFHGVTKDEYQEIVNKQYES